MNFKRFNAMHMPALEQNEARHNLILAIMAKVASGDLSGHTETWSLGEAGVCAIRTSGRGIILGELRQEHCWKLAEQVAGDRFISVLGPDDTALWFTERARELGERFAAPIAQRIHALSDAPNFPGAAGAARPVSAEDADLFVTWGAAFSIEATPDDAIPPRTYFEKIAASGDVVFWLADGHPVSMAGIVRRTRNAAAIAWVYTPPDLRGRGYAGAATSAVVEKIHAEGRRIACLYTDLNYPASNRCYAKIGFKPVCDSWFFRQIS